MKILTLFCFVVIFLTTIPGKSSAGTFFTAVTHNNLTSTLATRADFSSRSTTVDEDDNDLLARHKRTLIYNINGGVAKFVMTILVPVDLPKWQSLNWGVNLQAQYLTPDKSFYNPWQLTRKKRRRRSSSNSTEDSPDYSREFIYSLIETVMNRHRRNGRACLLRAICEVSQHPFGRNSHGFLGDLLDAIFIPPKGATRIWNGNATKNTAATSTPDVYYAAHLAGVSGVDCLRQFPECPHQDGILELVSTLA